MKIEFEDWDLCEEGGAFTLEMDTVPRVGERMKIEKSLMHPRYFEGVYLDSPPEQFTIDGVEFVCVKIVEVEHTVTTGGHVVCCGIEL